MINFPAPKTSTIVPRPYQSAALEALDAHMREKDTNPCVVIPTGGGKSILMAWAIQQWKQDYPPFRCCILAHRKELVEQNTKELMKLWPGVDVGVYAAALKKRAVDNSIIYASIDSVYNKWGEFAPFDVIIVDEAHRIPARGEGKYRQFINGCKKTNKNLKVIGFTATPFRMNCGPICHKDHILNEVCYDVNVVDLINDGYLCKLRSKVGDVQANMANVKRNSGGDYITNSLSEAVNGVVQGAVRSAVQIINAENRKSIVFFCVDLKHCREVTAELRKYGIHAPQVTGKTSVQERTRIADAFKAGQLRAIANVNVYTEGFNAKRVDCIVLLRPTLSPGLYMQMVGRGLRIHQSKTDCLVLDFAHCIETHGPIDCIDAGEVSVITCGECGDVFSRAVRVCPHCGWEIPKQEIERHEAAEREKRMHETEASKRSILSSEPEVYNVDAVIVSRHKKEGKPDSIKVQYRCGLQVFREWVCLDHEGYAGENARKWWFKRFGKTGPAPSVGEALSDMFLAENINRVTEKIIVKQRGKYTEILSHKLTIGPQNYYEREAAIR
jgi:DNA repair protein RadD